MNILFSIHWPPTSLIKKALGAILISLLLNACAHQTITPFTSDGCSSFPDGTLDQKQLWQACCTEHDYAYWKGGTYSEREEADEALRACVSKVGETSLALLMMAGVRVGGSPLFPTSFRWGYGWQYMRWYGKLSEHDKALVKEQVDLQ